MFNLYFGKRRRMKTVYFGGNIITMTGFGESAEAVLVQGGIIKGVGNKEEILRQAGEDAFFYDLKGRTMLPAFIDSHSHLSVLAQNLNKADLSEAHSFDDIVNILTEFIKTNHIKHGEYVQGYGYDPNCLSEGRHPDKTVLDRVSKENPIFISHVSCHMGVANTLALEQAGIDADNEQPNDLVGRYENSREPNGYLAEMGMLNIYIQLEKIPVDLSKYIEEAQKIYFQNGICTVQDGALEKEQFEALKKLSRTGALKADVVGFIMMHGQEYEILKDNPELCEKYKNHLKIGGYKMVLDGSPQGKTAWLSRPYTDGTNGSAWMETEQAAYLTKRAVDDNVQLLVHCNGDAASEQFLDCYEKAIRISKNPNKLNLRPVMIHSQTVRKDQLKRFGKLGMLPSFFVDHVYYWGDVHLKNLGEERANNISPAGWAVELDLPYTFHQDTPVVKPDMLRTIQTATERMTRNGVRLGEKQRISVYEALKAVTLNAAYQYFEEDQKGSIERGKYADFVLLEENPLTTEASKISEIKINATIYRGSIVYGQ